MTRTEFGDSTDIPHVEPNNQAVNSGLSDLPPSKPTIDTQQGPVEEDSAVTKAEKEAKKIGRYGTTDDEDSPAKRIKLDPSATSHIENQSNQSERRKGIAPIKAESVFLE